MYSEYEELLNKYNEEYKVNFEIPYEKVMTSVKCSQVEAVVREVK